MMSHRGRIHRGVLAAVLGLTVVALPACELNSKDRARAGGDGVVGRGGVATAAGTESGGAPGARLVSDTRPVGRPGGPGAVPGVAQPSKPPAPENVSYSDAEKIFRRGEYELAAEYFEAYATRRPENPWGHYMVGISAWRAGDHERAEAALRRTLEADSSHRKGLTNLARVLLEQRKASDALEYVERVVELDPESSEGWRVLGNARSELGMVDDAVAAYRRALVLDHRDAWTMNNLGLLMIREGRYEEAIRPLARAVELQPNLARFQNNLGIALERSGHLQEAAEAYRAALAADSGYAKASVSLERVESRLSTTVADPIDLAAKASDFAAEIEQWKERSLDAITIELDSLLPDSFHPEPVMPKAHESADPIQGDSTPDALEPNTR